MRMKLEFHTSQNLNLKCLTFKLGIILFPFPNFKIRIYSTTGVYLISLFVTSKSSNSLTSRSKYHYLHSKAVDISKAFYRWSFSSRIFVLRYRLKTVRFAFQLSLLQTSIGSHTWILIFFPVNAGVLQVSVLEQDLFLLSINLQPSITLTSSYLSQVPFLH